MKPFIWAARQKELFGTAWRSCYDIPDAPVSYVDNRLILLTSCFGAVLVQLLP